MDLLPSEIARLVWAYLSEFNELKAEADAFLHKCPHLRELSCHLKRGGRVCSRKVNEKTLQDHLNDINRPSVTKVEFDEQRLVCSLTGSIEELMNGQLSKLSHRTDVESQTTMIESKLHELMHRHANFDILNQTITEQFKKMNRLLTDIVEQNSKFETGIRLFSEQINQLQTKHDFSLSSFSSTLTSFTSKTTVASKQSNYSNDFKYLEDKLKVEMTNKSQYVTSFMLNEFVNLKNLLESIVNSNYQRIQESTTDLKASNQQFQSSQPSERIFPVPGQETPPSEPCRNEAAMNAINTPTSSELCSQSPSYSELSLGDLMSENTRANLNHQLSQVVCLVANNQPEKYADLITNVLYKTSSGQITELLVTPQKPVDHSGDSHSVPQTPSLQDKAGENWGNFSLNFNLVKLIDDILQSNSPLKNCLGDKGGELSTNKLFPQTPDICLGFSNELKKPDAVIKNFTDMLMTPKPKEILPSEPTKEEQVKNVQNENIETVKEPEAMPENEAMETETKQPEVQTITNLPQQMDSLPEIEDGEIADGDGADSNDSTESIDTQVLSVPAPVFANQHMVTRASPQHAIQSVPITTIERLPPSPIKTATSTTPLNDVTKTFDNVQDECFKKPSGPGRGSARGRAQKFASSQEQIRISLSQSDVAFQTQPLTACDSQSSQQVLYQDPTTNVFYAIDPNTLICVNDLEGNTYLQSASNLEDYYYQQNPDGTTELVSTASIPVSVASTPLTLPASSSGLAETISATTISMPTVSVSDISSTNLKSDTLESLANSSLSFENQEPAKEKTEENDSGSGTLSSKSGSRNGKGTTKTSGIGSGKGISRAKGAAARKGDSISKSSESVRSSPRGKPSKTGKGIKSVEKVDNSEVKSRKRKKDFNDSGNEDKSKVPRSSKLTLCTDFEEFLRSQH